MANNINLLIDAYRRLKQTPENVVLATIIETFGSTYQKAGAKMLIARDGELTGLLGGGCFEKDLMEQARSVFETGKTKAVFYDMRSPDDVIWGLGLGCNGAVRVLLQLLKAEEDFNPLNTIADAAQADTTGVLVTTAESGHPDFPEGNSKFLPSFAIDNERPSATAPFTASARQTLLQCKPRIEAQVIDGHDVKVFYDLIQPPLQLLVVGAGIDAVPVVRYAKSLGWRVTVIDHRPGHIKQERFPQADRLLHLIPEDLADNMDLDQFNALVLMTHNIEYDERYLKGIANSRIPFIGLLGPLPRKTRLLQSLGVKATRIRDRVFGPIGLDIGAETPEEIALAIMAAIHAAMNQRDGRQMNTKGKSDLCGQDYEPKKSVEMCREPFVLSLSKHEQLTAPSPIGGLPKPRLPFDKALLSAAEGLRANGVLEGPSDFFRMKASIDNVYAIILAAGASRRMGKPKQLLEWQNQPLLEHAIQNARSLLNERVFVVLAAQAESIQTAVDFDAVTTIVNPDWAEGVASSIRTGVQALPVTATAALILLCDQPLIRPKLIQTILTGWQNEPARMITSQYNNSIGVPALFPAEFFRPLLELKGDQGAKRLLQEFGDRVLKIPLPEAELDIDTMGDFNHLTRHYSAKE